MNLLDVFNSLQYGELKNVSLSGEIDEVKGIRQEDWAELITHINLALTDMHTKLNLKEREVTVTQSELLTFYELHSDYAVSTPVVGTKPKYINDTVENPFTDDILRINSVYDELGCEYAINDENDPYSLFLPKYNVIQVPYPADGNSMFILYRSNHTKIDINAVDPSMVEVDIPAYCLEPLLAYVGSRVHATRTSPEGQGLSVNLMAKYNLMVEDLKKYNVLHNDPNMTNIKLGERGWV